MCRSARACDIGVIHFHAPEELDEVRDRIIYAALDQLVDGIEDYPSLPMEGWTQEDLDNARKIRDEFAALVPEEVR